MSGNEASAIPTQSEFSIPVSCGYRIRKSGPFVSTYYDLPRICIKTEIFVPWKTIKLFKYR